MIAGTRNSLSIGDTVKTNSWSVKAPVGTLATVVGYAYYTGDLFYLIMVESGEVLEYYEGNVTLVKSIHATHTIHQGEAS